MLLLVFPTTAAGINFAAYDACMCPAVDGTFFADKVVVPTDMHCLPAVGAASAVVVDVVAGVAAFVAGAAIVAVYVAALVVDVVAVGVATLTSLSAAAPSTLLVCPAQTFPSPSVLSLSTHVLRMFLQATFFAARACMHLCTCRPHHVCH